MKFLASLDKEMVPSLPQGNLATVAADSTILFKAARPLVVARCEDHLWPFPKCSLIPSLSEWSSSHSWSVCQPVRAYQEHRLAFSLGSDLFNVTKGHVKPAKQLVIGLGMKSITGSEKVCKILHI